MARPRKVIDLEQLDRCAEKHWTHEEIAAHFRVSADTIKRRFADRIEECRERGKAKLRDLQWRRALDGSDRVLLHMSEHYLKQQRTEKREVTGKDGAPLESNAPQIIITMPSNGREK